MRGVRCPSIAYFYAGKLETGTSKVSNELSKAKYCPGGERSRGCHALQGSTKDDLKIGDQLQARIMIMPTAEHKGGIMKRFTFDFGVYELHQHYILAHPSEGTLAGRHEFGMLSAIVSDYYHTPFGFIANRINHSATDLTIYKRITKLYPQLKVVAIVSYRPLTSIIAETERLLLSNLHFKIFNELSAAKKWTLDTLGIKE